MNNTVVILPTYNEAENLRELIPKLKQYDVDILVVDDSPDSKTVDVAKSLGVSVLSRGKKGRVSALLDGIATTTQQNVITMDSDGQHPPEVVPKILEALGRSDVVVASRYIDGGSCKGFSPKRRVISYVARLLALPLIPKVKDRTSGIVAFHRNVLEGVKAGPRGFSTLTLRILVMGRYNTLEEVPYDFLAREEGASKLSYKMMLNHLEQLVRLYLYKFRLLRFALVGTSGVAVGLGSLYLLTEYAGIHYLVSYVIAFVLSVTNNYIWNSMWTFGRLRSMAGWIKYTSVCTLTLTGNVVLMYVLTDIVGLWYMFSAAVCTLAAFLANYALSRRYVWRS